ncbi:hypothetical protein [Treponema zioleckii]|nr:hypothetical protein [Treponema zioleckii]
MHGNSLFAFVVISGAVSVTVLTEGYASQIGADYYAKEVFGK